jgi:hypothetical protein
MKHPTKRTRARVVRATKATTTAPLSDKDLVDVARQAVPKRLHGTARIVRPARGRALAGKAGPDLASEVADLVGAKLPPDDPSEVVVEFTDETELGKRYRMVHLRDGKVTNVVTRAARA